MHWGNFINSFTSQPGLRKGSNGFGELIMVDSNRYKLLLTRAIGTIIRSID